MKINAEFDKPARVSNSENDWINSPLPGVERKMLDRIGDEVARATTVVRYAPKSAFTTHTHDGGEEFLVLEGVFQDEHGDYPSGYYVRNPPTSSHTPSSADGCTILVKLHQFDPADRTFTQIDTNKSFFVNAVGRPGVAEIPLFKDAQERVRLEKWTADTSIFMDRSGGVEIFVVEGAFSFDGQNYERWDWLRLPPGGNVSISAGPDGARVYVKSDHLRNLVFEGEHGTFRSDLAFRQWQGHCA